MKFFFNLLINQTDYLEIDTFKKSDDSDDSRAHFKYYVQRKKKSKKRINDFLLAQTSKEPKAPNYTVILNNYDTFSYACLRITCERISFADSCSICEEEEGRMVRVARIRRQYRDTIVEIIGAVPSLCLLPDYREGKERGENGRDR